MIKYSIRKISSDAFKLNFEGLTADETADMLVVLRRFQRTREGAVTSPKAMADFLSTTDVGFSVDHVTDAAKG